MTPLAPPLLAGLLAQSREWLVVSDVAGRITWVNPAFAQGSGWLAPLGASLLACLAPDTNGDPAELQRRLSAALHTGGLDDTVVQLQVPAAMQTADPLWLRLRIGSSGDSRLWTMSDIRAERADRARSRRLEELLDTAQEFGRLGAWERDIATGQGRWDEHVFRSFDDASAQLALAVDLGQIAVWRHDLHSNRMFYNRRGFEVLDIPYRAEGLSIEEVRSHIHPDDLPGVVAAGQRALMEPGPTDMEARYRRADGVWRQVLTRRVVQRDAGGAPVAFIGVALDMTDRVERQRQADELQRRLEYATAAAGIGVWSRDTVTEEAHWNAQMYRLCNRAPELGPPSGDEWIEQVIHPDDRAAMRQARPQPMDADSGAVEHEYRILAPDGEVRWLANRARLEEWNGHPVIFGVTLDITERRLADQALRQANDRIALATRGAGIATWEHDLATDEVRWDAQMYALRGLTPPTGAAELQRAPHALRMSLAHPDELPLLVEINRRSLEEGTMASYEFRARMPDGSYRWLASRSIPVYDESGRALRQIGVNWDIHERVSAEAMRREALASQRQSEAKSQFLARMSHELRTPLNAILGFTQLLEFDAQHPDETGSAAARGATPNDRLFKLRHIRNASEQLLSLVNEVLDLSSIEAGEVQMQPAPVALDDLVQQVLAEVRPAAAARAIKLETATAGHTVVADATRLRQVLFKLLEHRIRRVAPGSTVQLCAARDGADAVLIIGDDDRALTPTQQLNLFAPFGGNGPGDAADGGVDMALVKALMACMSGRIELDGSMQHGTRFMLWLPCAGPSSQVAPTLRASADSAPVRSNAGASTDAAPPARAGKVLYIEDNLVNVILVEELIAQRGGLDLVCETTGGAGVARASVMQPDLVLIDMQLPDFDGFEVLRRLRAGRVTAEAKCIALSANAIPDDVARALAAGFDDYWTKPIRFHSFLAGLDRLFPPARVA